ncbi:hypothetical protein [Orrella sp. 11846]|uniref:hypothetical protein n=1 Tax=Orrella sp. 11846 TaxID=3409913 RepID=UPI003B5901D5
MSTDLLTALGATGAMVVAFLLAFFSGKREGKQQAEREQEKARLDNLTKLNEVDNGLAKKSDDDIRRRLGDWVQRDGD